MRPRAVSAALRAATHRLPRWHRPGSPLWGLICDAVRQSGQGAMAAIGGGRRTQATAHGAAQATGSSASSLPADAANYSSTGATMKSTTTDKHDGLEAAPRGTWSGAHLVTDYFGFERRGFALTSPNGEEKRISGRHFRGARRSAAMNRRVSALRAKLRVLQADFGVTVYGPERFTV